MNKLYFGLLIFYLFSTLIFAADSLDYSGYNTLLKKYVNEKTVNYQDLIKEKKELDKFTKQLAKISPDSHKELFPKRSDKLSYWINAYNAYILQTIIENYPVKSIKDINFIGATIWWKKNKLGGEKISFKSLEDDIIRDRFKDPRIHFAINCASISCPPLMNEAFIPDLLEEQLDNNTIKFINQEENFRIDEENKKIRISAIFDWYEDDYLEWLEIEYPEMENPTIIDFIKLYYKNEFNQKWYDYEIEVNDYDWALNE